MKLLALTFGGEVAASTKFRVLQYRGAFDAAGIEMDWVPTKEFEDFSSLSRYDVVLLQKTLVGGSTLRKIRKGARRLVYDADDLIWLSPGKRNSLLTRLRIERRLRGICAAADLCLCANGVIAGEIAERGGRAKVVPMALDGRIWRQREAEGKTLTVGWSGAPHNLRFLGEILPQLREVQRRHPGVQWLIHSGEDPAFSDFAYTWVPFVPGGEPEAVRALDVGLLPLPEDPFVRGKSPIKALQYFASGVAVAGSPVGATAEILRHEENALQVESPQKWAEVLERLLSDPALRRRLATAGRRTFETQHDLTTVAGALMAELREVAGGCGR